MEALKVLDIEFDLNQCSKLYDYGNGVYLTRPDEGWDHQAIADTCKQGVAPDEQVESMLIRMDNILGEEGLLEKSKENEKGMKFDNFSSNFSTNAATSLPKRVIPVFNPGDVISGQLVLEATDIIEAEEVKIKFKGLAFTSLTFWINDEYDAEGSEVYAKEVVVVWRKAQSGDNISPGKHTFPFSFTIPVDCQQSVPELLKWSSDWAHIAYYIKATINKGKTLSRGNIVTNRGLWVQKAYDIAQHPEYLTPIVQEETQKTGVLTKGHIRCRATLPARAYIRGRQNQIPLKLEIDNQSRGPIESVKACVVLNGCYRGKIRRDKSEGTKSIKFKGARVRGDAIPSGMCPELSLQVPLSFEEDGLDGNLIPAGTLDGCGLIDVYYDIQVLLERKGLHLNMELRIPIYIGTENSKDSLYPDLGKLSL